MDGRLSIGGKTLVEWPKRPNHNNHKTHCGCETSLQKIEQVRAKFLRISVYFCVLGDPVSTTAEKVTC